ncbi:MAG: PRC-barrel domain containing protein [Propionibacteriales bacterium]|nr:PRC-barrel domain containing protein [Propionibacteriales bacterium]
MTETDLEQLHDALVVAEGRTIGQVGQVFLDQVTHAPVFVTVTVRLFTSRSSFVPLQGAHLADGRVTVPFSRSMIKSAPLLDPQDRLDPEQTADIYRHYGLCANDG